MAPSVGEKIKQQELIVSQLGKKLASAEVHCKAGTSRREDVLIATDTLLQSQQEMEELRAKSKQG